jgi:hypothetical protein
VPRGGPELMEDLPLVKPRAIFACHLIQPREL